MQVPDVCWQCGLKGRVCNNCALACCFLLGTHGLVHWTSPSKQVGAAVYRRALAGNGSAIVLGSKLTSRHAAWVRRPCVRDGTEARQRVPDARVAAQGALPHPLARKSSMLPNVWPAHGHLWWTAMASSLAWGMDDLEGRRLPWQCCRKKLLRLLAREDQRMSCIPRWLPGGGGGGQRAQALAAGAPGRAHARVQQRHIARAAPQRRAGEPKICNINWASCHHKQP